MQSEACSQVSNNNQNSTAMRIVINKIIPFKGYQAMCLFPFIFVREEAYNRFDEVALNHECIHAEQQKEMLVLPFLLWYLLEWAIKSVRYWSTKKGYRKVSFEQEAYLNERNFDYLKGRKRFTWLKFVFK